MVWGRCVFCGYVGDVRPVKFPKTFTAYQYLQAGDGACETCYKLFKDPNVRRRSWVWVSDGLRFLEDPLEALLNPPEPPFRMYIARTGKKHGWIRVVNLVNYSRDTFYVAYDEDLIYVDRGVLRGLVDFAVKLRGLGFSKRELRSGEPMVKNADKITVEEYRRLKDLKGNPLWEMVVDLVR